MRLSFHLIWIWLAPVIGDRPIQFSVIEYCPQKSWSEHPYWTLTICYLDLPSAMTFFYFLFFYLLPIEWTLKETDESKWFSSMSWVGTISQHIVLLFLIIVHLTRSVNCTHLMLHFGWDSEILLVALREFAVQNHHRSTEEHMALIAHSDVWLHFDKLDENQKSCKSTTIYHLTRKRCKVAQWNAAKPNRNRTGRPIQWGPNFLFIMGSSPVFVAQIHGIQIWSSWAGHNLPGWAEVELMYGKCWFRGRSTNHFILLQPVHTSILSNLFGKHYQLNVFSE